jgi:hypothetical protein
MSLTGPEICRYISRIFLWDRIVKHDYHILQSMYDIDLPYTRYVSLFKEKESMVVVLIKDERIMFRSLEVDVYGGFNVVSLSFEEFMGLKEIHMCPYDSFTYNRNNACWLVSEMVYFARCNYAEFHNKMFYDSDDDNDHEDDDNSDSDNDSCEKVRDNLNSIMEIIDSNKENMSNGDYLKLCNELKQVYTSNKN